MRIGFLEVLRWLIKGLIILTALVFLLMLILTGVVLNLSLHVIERVQLPNLEELVPPDLLEQIAPPDSLELEFTP